MWQADSFDPKRIDLELGWAASLGMNTMRVFLHDLATGLTSRVSVSSAVHSVSNAPASSPQNRSREVRT